MEYALSKAVPDIPLWVPYNDPASCLQEGWAVRPPTKPNSMVEMRRSKYVFLYAETRKKRALNTLTVTEDANGQEVVEEQKIASVIAWSFQDIFTTKSSWDFSVVQECLQWNLTGEMNEFLIWIRTHSDIREAIFASNVGKAPRPGRFSAKFYQSYWHIAGYDVINDIRRFFTHITLDPHNNETHIRSIPKLSGSRKVFDYHHIALCNIHYKIVTKILTCRLNPLLPCLITN